MESSDMKNMVVIKNLPSNMVEVQKEPIIY